MKKHLLLFAMILLPLVASADAVEINGIYYNLITKGKIAEVTSNPNKYTGSVVIPEKVTYESIEYSVTSIGDDAFSGCSGLTSVTIPNSVTSIGSYAFHYCSGLTSITIPNSVTTIDNYAFFNCSGLTSITIPNSVTRIGRKVFANCDNLTTVIIGNSVTSIEDAAFFYCSGLTSITIPNSVTRIGVEAFEGCFSLKKVIVKDIAAWCGIKFSSNPLEFAKHLYSDENTEITNLVIPNSVTSIEDAAFFNCRGLTSIVIPNSVTSIGISTFSFCKGLTFVTIPNSVTSIGNRAFYACSSLTSITIPNSVTSIGVSAFQACSSLTSITIGGGIKNIYGSAFASCPELTDVTCYAENVPSTGTDAFKDSYIEYTTLHVPASAVNAYKAADPWKNFKNIIEVNPTGINAIENTQTKNTTIYDLNGVRLSEPKKGINIINGKKVVIK